jgi:hypothetical protein
MCDAWEARSSSLDVSEPSQHLLEDRAKGEKTCIKMTGRGTFRIRNDFRPEETEISQRHTNMCAYMVYKKLWLSELHVRTKAHSI